MTLNLKKKMKMSASEMMKSTNQEATNRLTLAATSAEETIFTSLNASAAGMTDERAEESRDRFGSNILPTSKRTPLGKRLASAFINPFTIVLLILALVSVLTNVAMVDPGDESWATVIIITVMVLISGVLRFVQETRSGNVAAKLSEMIHTTASVLRDGERKEIPLEDIVVGDIVYLSAGDMMPADVRILTAKDLFVSQASLTGESEPVEKSGSIIEQVGSLTECDNLGFMGSTVVSGSATAVVLAVGYDTMLGAMADALNVKPPKTTFEKGVNSVSWVLIRFMLLMVPLVLVINGLTDGDWVQAGLFAISIAVGLTPEMLPMIVTTSLAKGAMAMSRERVIIKDLNAIQNLGSMDLLCTDKTGTLTQDKVVLEYHLNVDGESDDRVLRHAFLNSYFQTGLKNLIDLAVIDVQCKLGAEALIERYEKVDEIPFDFERRRMSVVVRDRSGKTQLVTKGAIEEMLRCCSFAELHGEVLALTDEVRARVLAKADELNDRGMRVIAVAQKTNPAPVGQFSAADEANMVLIGFLAFLDPPKETTRDAIAALHEYGVGVKILTGDNEKVTCAICRQVGLSADRVLTGAAVDALSDEALAEEAEQVTVFAKLSPAQKARVVQVLRDNGHSVGYMGDGINDAAAMKAADVGISVDTAVDIAKESASVVLLEKDLMVLEKGVLEGRRIYANMMKYIKMTAASNFGNMFSVLAASAFLPFLPMSSLHLILLNMIYDISCTAIPWDNVDTEYLRIPRKWDASGISRFMLWMGPVSSLFDILTYLLLYFVIAPMCCAGMTFTQLTSPAMQDVFASVFQTGWFIESMWSQTLVLHMIRTRKLPFIQSRASRPVLLLTALGIGIVTLLPFTPLAAPLGLTALPAVYFAYLALIIVGYMALATLMKHVYVKKYGELL